MAVRGRKPKPRDLKLMTGNPGRRPLDDPAPDFTGALVLPAWIEEKAPAYRSDFLAEWNRVTRQLEDWGVVGEVNQSAIEGICALYAQAIQSARSDGEKTETRQSFDAHRKALNEFGLTPASKGRAGGKTKKSDPADEFFRAG